MNGPIAVLAGTPVDTRMGVAYLEERGLPGVPFPLSRGPREQTCLSARPGSGQAPPGPGGAEGRHGPGLSAGFRLLQLPVCGSGFPGACGGDGDADRDAAGRVPAAGAPLPGAGGHRRQRPGTLRHRESIAGGQSRPGSAGGLCAAGGAGRGGGDAAGGAGGTPPSGGAGSVVCRRRDGGAGAGLHALPLF